MKLKEQQGREISRMVLERTWSAASESGATQGDIYSGIRDDAVVLVLSWLSPGQQDRAVSTGTTAREERETRAPKKRSESKPRAETAALDRRVIEHVRETGPIRGSITQITEDIGGKVTQIRDSLQRLNDDPSSPVSARVYGRGRGATWDVRLRDGQEDGTDDFDDDT